MLQTERLILRKWTEPDADSLYEYAKDPAVGPIAGWPSHQSKEESLDVIRNVFNGAECYAICKKGSDKAIGAIELMLHGHSSNTECEDECELGFQYHHTCENVPVPLMNEVRTEHITVMTREHWDSLCQDGG